MLQRSANQVLTHVAKIPGFAVDDADSGGQAVRMERDRVQAPSGHDVGDGPQAGAWLLPIAVSRRLTWRQGLRLERVLKIRLLADYPARRARPA
ncbi:MAG: hypothetical protein OXQ89_04250 [Rhodospirillaceae bacterium]|nr:hypothetical protein [Rhodospirillaceae bacterium]MDE0241266.1 hypothetical protein [bacterium]